MMTGGASRERKDRDSFPKPGSAVSSNRVLAGYLAHEFLTKGTLLGHKFDPTRVKKWEVMEQESYTEVATILKTDGVHIPGIVNPTQLARWIKR